MKEKGENSVVFSATGFRRATWQPEGRKKYICFALLILLTGEVIGLSFYIDIHNIVAPAHLPLPELFAPTRLFRFFLAFFSAVMIFEIGRLKAEIHTDLQLSQSQFGAFWFVLHLLAFAAFVTLSMQLDTAGNKTASPEKAAAYLAIWPGLAAAFILFWLRSFAHLTWWWQWLKNARRSLLAAAWISLLIIAVSALSQVLWHGFNGLTFQVVEFLLLLQYPTVIVDKTAFVLGTPAFAVEIAPGCSGYEGMGLVTVFLGLYLWLHRQELLFPQALLLLPLGLTVIWFFNALRIAALIAIGSSGSPDIAMDGFHSQAGWIAFILVALMLMWAAGHLPGLTKTVTLATIRNTPHATLATALLVPFMLLIAVQMLTAAVSAGDDSLYPVKIIAAAAALWIYRPVYQSFLGKVTWPAVPIGVAVFVTWWLLEPVATTPTKYFGGFLELPADYTIVWKVFRVIGSVLVVPLAEELLFRGYLLRKLLSIKFETVDPRRFTWLSWLVSSLLFGWLHQRWLAGSLAGLTFAYAQYRNGHLLDAVVAHVTANALISVAVLAFGYWQLW